MLKFVLSFFSLSFRFDFFIVSEIVLVQLVQLVHGLTGRAIIGFAEPTFVISCWFSRLLCWFTASQ
jgi:hypothetical protein